jgi:hypothetical protein
MKPSSLFVLGFLAPGCFGFPGLGGFPDFPRPFLFDGPRRFYIGSGTVLRFFG